MPPSRGRFGSIGVPLVVSLALVVAGSAFAASASTGSHSPSALPQASGLAASPSPSPSDTTPPTTVASGAPAGWTDKAVTVTLTATDNPGGSGVASITYSLDGGSPTTVAAATTQITIAAPADHANDGVHTLSFYATDNAGNAESRQSLTVKIATRPPHLSGETLRPGLLHRTAPLVLHFSLTDLTGSVRVSYQLYDAWGVRVVRGAARSLATGRRSLRLRPVYADGRGLLPGLYRVRLALRDAAGNKAVTAPLVFRDLRSVQATIWRDVRHAGRRVALTFDDGYDEAALASIIATLHAYHEHATFFVNGRYVVAFPAIARRTVAWGNAIGSHTWSHILTTTETAAQIRSQVELDVQAWWRVARATPVPYFRPPYGGYDAQTLAVVGAAGFARVMLWSVDPSDYTDPGPAVIAARVLAEVHSGSIVELHLKPQTAAALPEILQGLRARHYEEVSLPELFHAAGYH
jgi:peptidoglycan/xylan/chitin deacetylase (PgdA/CDA1 family)